MKETQQMAVFQQPARKPNLFAQVVEQHRRIELPVPGEKKRSRYDLYEN
jgi:hypothetical protein